jgi:hypothetical protein
VIDPLLRGLGVDLDRTLEVTVEIGDHALAAAVEPFAELGFRTSPSMSLSELLAQA